MTHDRLRDPATRGRWIAGSLAALLLHAAPAAATFVAFTPNEKVWEDVGLQMVVEFADVTETAETSDSVAEASESQASQSTPEVKKSLSAAGEDDLPETDASPRKPDDPDLLLAEKKTLERTEESAEQQTTEEMAPSQAAADSAASASAAAPSPVEQTAATTAAPSEGSVREAPPTPASWAKAVMAHLGRHKRYPREARASGAEGEVLVAVTVGRDGRVVARRLHRTAGSAVLDGAALDLIDRAAPLPAMPANFLADHVDVVVPIRFRLKS
ncbi:energy transducer TonB [Pinisolibacter aquiterrae]|uniref:energy transducer TonB n=1 Tax=Pinisolibacter aquiterrae TaxID=2815579 RepID=UPI001C3DF8FB|nr:energy transducer TonB [Pinisolibacter aquiterrae]MBV5265205.1 energy transducer TonB [Pinisolibacter aquiterrae]MCC8235465.1 energy transducer TonB [Pinisolibacter aquiterrae]